MSPVQSTHGAIRQLEQLQHLFRIRGQRLELVV